MTSRVGVIVRSAKDAEAVGRAAEMAGIAAALVLRNARRRSPLVSLVGIAPAAVLRREVRRAVAELEQERRRQRRRWVRASIVLGLLTAAAATGSSLRRGTAVDV